MSDVSPVADETEESTPAPPDKTEQADESREIAPSAPPDATAANVETEEDTKAGGQ